MLSVYTCGSLGALRAEYADLFITTISTTQSNHMRGVHNVIGCLNFVNA